MAYTQLTSLLVVLGSAKYVNAAMIQAPTPAVTAAPSTTAAALAVRDITTIGYISTGMYGSTTLYETITANNEGHVIATSGSLYKICAPESLCEFFSCESEYAVFPTTSVFCGGPSSTCSYWELATDINDPAPLTNYWCDDKTETGGKILMVTPDPDDDSSTSPNTDSSSNTPVSLSFTPLSTIASRGPSDAPIPLTPSSGGTEGKRKKSTPVGAIAGGVVGGIALLAAVILGVFFLLRRKKKQQNVTNNNMQQPPTAPQAPPAGVQYYHEQKPVAPQQVQQMPSPPPQHQQHYGHYDPNAQQAPQYYDPNAQSAYGAQQGGYAMPEKTPAAVNPVQANPHYSDGPVSPVPQYTPSTSPAVPANINELPSGRM